MTDPTSPQQTVLFTDLRHIRCGDLQWFSPAGDKLPLIAPPEPPVEAQARTGMVPHGVRFVAEQATKTDRLPDESRLGRGVLYENGRYRSWALEAHYPPGRNYGSYAREAPVSVSVRYGESDDGFDWREPVRATIDVPGQTGFDGWGFFVDSHGPPEERYKVVYSAIPPQSEWRELWEAYQRVHPRYREDRISERKLHCLYVAVSPDGLRWTANPKPLMTHQSDTDTNIAYDDWLGRYVLYTRLYRQERRWVGRAEAERLDDWGPIQPILWPQLDWHFADDIYTNGKTHYPGAAGDHLMFPWIYERFTQTGGVHLYTSADNVCWNKVPGGAVIPTGEAGAWDGEYLAAMKDLVPLGPDRVGILYSGTPFPHKYPRWQKGYGGGVAWAWWPRGRLCAVVADEIGEFFTFPMVPAGRELRLNLRARRGGEVRVGLVGVPGRSVEECDPLYGDELGSPVHWQGETNLGLGEGESVTLHFKLRAAELFGFSWA